MGCFTKGTKVKTPLGYATIESLKKGDLVKSYDTKVEAKVDSEVTETFLHENHDGYLVINGNIKTTSNHPFYSNGDWVDAGELSVGDKILHVDGLEHTVESIENYDDTIDVYNIEVDGNHNYYAENYLVHNKGIESVGAGEAVMISGSSGLEPKAQISMSVGDKVLSANITGLPDSDTASEYLLWEYTGSDITSQLTLATSSVSAVGSGSYIQWVSIQAENGLDNPVTMTPSHTILTWSGSSYPHTGSWFFEYAGDIVPGNKFLSSSLEVIDVTSWQFASASVSQSFYRSNIEPHDVYFVDGILVHN
jgi:hypothetical protein|tara:strand:+ start:4435 stop:5355 length:921 start_codon:yes stop_codon:yes gene_type:complete